jgi:hypothetical protein
MKVARKLGVLCLLLVCAPVLALAQQTWQQALSGMPLVPPINRLTSTNCVAVCLKAFQSNGVVKALVFMPGATDRLYFFHDVKADLTNRAPSLLDAVMALTNQTRIRAEFQSPFLLLHSHEDVLEADITVRDQATLDKLHRVRFVRHAQYNDRDWDYLVPELRFRFNLEFLPTHGTMGSWHFYRYSLAGWDLNGYETVRMLALAGKCKVTVERKQVVFVPDRRYN